jgi:hypothetical protein
MTKAHKTSTLATPESAFQVNASWYESYWYGDQSQPKRLRSFLRVFLTWVCATFAAGSCLGW